MLNDGSHREVDIFVFETDGATVLKGTRKAKVIQFSENTPGTFIFPFLQPQSRHNISRYKNNGRAYPPSHILHEHQKHIHEHTQTQFLHACMIIESHLHTCDSSFV